MKKTEEAVAVSDEMRSIDAAGGEKSLWGVSNWGFVLWLMEMVESANEAADDVAEINPVVPW